VGGVIPVPDDAVDGETVVAELGLAGSAGLVEASLHAATTHKPSIQPAYRLRPTIFVLSDLNRTFGGKSM
jgi:hypothetical protein